MDYFLLQNNSLILLQITIAKTYDIKTAGVKRLFTSLPNTIKNIHIVIVIPDGLVHEYRKAKSVPTARAIKPKAKDLRVCQYRLILNEQKIQSMALVGPFKQPAGRLGRCQKGTYEHDVGDTTMGGME